ncbi:DUF2262 domain-containing protein [Undibacterium sp. CY7W]|uniref:DUF2262 domain-containing protein n=1 Tax=Undibacterium rugosum TaxID=2762291 RepID=A0A923KVM0_9BURK|nr:DUF2262 domain-containing protein [Undibacterium rugosum]MBC3935512.1 DUF2262 domain-containing protein [Undibacterium rugosum]
MSTLNHLKRLLRLGSVRTKPVPTLTAAIEHPLLGSLQVSDRFPTSLTGRIAYRAGDIHIGIDPDGSNIANALALACKAVESLPELDLKFRNLIAEKFLDSYNAEWRFWETINSDGSKAQFEKPELTKAEFCAQLRLNSLDATGPSSLSVWYDDNDIFWGHHLGIVTFDGITLNDIHITM